MRRAAAIPGDHAGVAAIEFSVALAIVLLVAFGLIEFGRAIWTQATLDYAVQAAARCAVIDQTTCDPNTPSTIQAYAATKAPGLALRSSTFSFDPDGSGCVAANAIKVSATLPFRFVVPELLPYSLTLGAQACYSGAAS